MKLIGSTSTESFIPDENLYFGIIFARELCSFIDFKPLIKNFSSKVKLNYKHDESLIGGLIVQVGSTMVDTSIKNKLQQIENRMIEA